MVSNYKKRSVILKMNTKTLVVGLIVGLLAGTIVGISISNTIPQQYYITIAGSTTVYPLSQEWATRIGTYHPNFIVNPATGGSGLGQSQIASGIIDIGASSSYPSQDYRNTNPHVKIIPICADALAVVANPAVNGSTLRLDSDMLVAIFQRNVTTWEQLESTFGVNIQQTGDIEVYARSDASGTTATFGKWLKTAGDNPNPYANYTWLLGDSESVSWVAGVNAVEGNPGVASSVQSDPRGIGYVALEFIEGLTAAEIYNYRTQEYVTPCIANVFKALPDQLTDPGQNLMNSARPGAYPIVRLLYYLVNEDRLYWYVIVYLNWCITQGQRYVTNVGYIPVNGTSIASYSTSVIGTLTPTA